MYLSRLIVENYRSIKKADVVFLPGKNIIIGKNNSGKSNIVRAIDLVLGEKSPDYVKSENIDQKDFYMCKEDDGSCASSDNIKIICELTRKDGEVLNEEEIGKCYGFYKLNSPFHFAADYNDLDQIEGIDFEELSSSDKTYINAKLINQGRGAEELKNISKILYVFEASIDTLTLKVTRKLTFLYQIYNTQNWWLASRASIRNELLQSAIIKSFRDPQNELRISGWSWYGKLLKNIVGNADISRIKTKFDEVSVLANEIFDDAQKSIENSALDVAFPGTDLYFQFNEDFNTEIYKDCRIYIDDGIKSFIGEKGSGIQSAAVIGLFSYYTQYVNSVACSLLCVEEPELYLHPHARRVISDKLDAFVNIGNGNQVILTTHSSEFIKTVNPSINIIKVDKDKVAGSTVLNKKITDKSLLLDNNHNEIFFADKVIVSEGLDEYIVRWVSKEKFASGLDENNISVVSVGGKDNIVKFVKMLTELDIKCFVLSDFDFLLRDQNVADAKEYQYEDSRKRLRWNAHMSLENLCQKFWSQSYIRHDTLTKVKEERTRIKSNFKEQFYRAKKSSEIDLGASEFADYLQKVGIGVLRGEIEDLFLSDTYLNSKGKLDLEGIYNISSYLVSDASNKIGNILDIVGIEQFLKTVFES